MLLFYIRHGEPIYDPDSLTELGKKQAEALSKRLAVYGLDKIYSSTSNRAYQTALPTAKLLNKEIVQIDFFNEMYTQKYFAPKNDQGVYQWIDERMDIKKKFMTEDVYKWGYEWYNHPDFAKYPFKEGMEFFEKNYDEFMLSLGYEHNKKTHTYKVIRKNDDRVAIFAHGEMGGVFISYLLGIPYPIYLAHSAMSHTGVTVLDFGGEGEIIPRLLQFSNDSHLYKEGLHTKYCNTIPI